MNNTKWEELRMAMYELGKQDPELNTKWRTKCLNNGFVSDWDGDWFYHFREGGYELTEWVEIRVESDRQSDEVSAILGQVHVPIEKTNLGVRVFGYISPGQGIEYAVQ